MDYIDNIHSFPKQVRIFFLFFTLCLSIGYFTGFKFIHKTTDLDSQGIEENYLGNEADEDAEVMKFRKPEAEILTTVHTHILSFSLIFFCLGGILLSVPLNQKIKNFLLIEPFVSIVVTFGGIWLLWTGITWVKYFVMLSGMILTISFVSTVGVIILHCLKTKSRN
ncbi:MAG: hypothetical protein JXR07_05265 [Reichenbachiella sp.]